MHVKVTSTDILMIQMCLFRHKSLSHSYGKSKENYITSKKAKYF